MLVSIAATIIGGRLIARDGLRLLVMDTLAGVDPEAENDLVPLSIEAVASAPAAFQLGLVRVDGDGQEEDAQTETQGEQRQDRAPAGTHRAVARG